MPSTGAAWPFKLTAVGTNQFLTSDYVLAQKSGVLISSNAPVDTKWSSPGETATLTACWTREQGDTLTEGWNGTSGQLKDGYVGIRFYAADGSHYGWIRVRLPKSETTSKNPSLLLSPIVVEWAYEAEVGVPIEGGAIIKKTRANKAIQR